MRRFFFCFSSSTTPPHNYTFRELMAVSDKKPWLLSTRFSLFFLLAHLYILCVCLLSSKVITSWPKLPQMNMNAPVVASLVVAAARARFTFSFYIFYLFIFMFFQFGSSVSNRQWLVVVVVVCPFQHWKRRVWGTRQIVKALDGLAGVQTESNVTLMMWKMPECVGLPNPCLFFSSLLLGFRLTEPFLLHFQFHFSICKFKACEIETSSVVQPKW